MKPTYHVMFNHSEPSDDESARWQNFDQLITEYQAVRRHRRPGQRWRYGTLLLVGLGLVGAGIGYYRSAVPLAVPPLVTALPPSPSVSPLPTINRTQLPSVSPPVMVSPPAVIDPPTTSSAPPSATVATDSGGLVEAQPAGGYPALYDYFATQLVYPEAARRAGIAGSVLVEFTIDTKGKPTNIRVVQGIPELEQEAIRLVEEMPAWSPATVGGQPIATQHTMPLTFQITNP